MILDLSGSWLVSFSVALFIGCSYLWISFILGCGDTPLHTQDTNCSSISISNGTEEFDQSTLVAKQRNSSRSEYNNNTGITNAPFDQSTLVTQQRNSSRSEYDNNTGITNAESDIANANT